MSFQGDVIKWVLGLYGEDLKNAMKGFMRLASSWSIILVNIFFYLLFAFFIRKLWRVMFDPIHLVRDISFVRSLYQEFMVGTPPHTRQNINRKLDELPPVYPNGWFKLLRSDQIGEGQVKSLSVLGENFAIYRSYKGVVRVLDAYCPHLGANMALGGSVLNSDCIQCPFHGWTFDGATGKCVDVPYSTQNPPEFASVKSWPVREVNGIVFVWYHSSGESPSWEIPVVPEVKKYKYVGITKHFVDGHVEDILENGADLSHFLFMHRSLLSEKVGEYESCMEVFSHDTKVKWQACEDSHEKHSSMVLMDTSLYIRAMKLKIPLMSFSSNIKQLGPGIYHWQMDFGGWKIIAIATVTPEGPLYQRFSRDFYVSPSIPLFIPKLIVAIESRQINKDLVVWGTKTYKSKPNLVKEDSSIAQHRRWYSQFYTTNSPKTNSLDGSVALTSTKW